MRYLWILLCALVLTSHPVAAQNKPFNLLIMGDSLSAGYGLNSADAFYSKLDRALKNQGYTNVNVINFSRSGETTTGGVNKLQQALAQRPDAVILELGINDALRDVPVDTTTNNLERIIQTFKNYHIPVMLVGMQAPLIKPAPYQQQFTKMYMDLAKKHNLIFYPFFMDGVFKGTSLIALQMPNENVLSDRMHPSAKGVEIMVQKILPTVRNFLNATARR